MMHCAPLLPCPVAAAAAAAAAAARTAHAAASCHLLATRPPLCTQRRRRPSTRPTHAHPAAPTHARARLAALNSEQKALLDFLVLARAERFAGFGSSTFSFYLREYRALQARAAGGGSRAPLCTGCAAAAAQRSRREGSAHGNSEIGMRPWPPCASLPQGLARKTSGLVDASIIGTDSLFHSAGTVI